MPVSEVTIADVLEILALLWYTKAPTAIETVRESTTPSALKLAFEFLVLTAALAHIVQNKVEAAYRRTDLFERRRRLMDDWAAYLTGQIRGPEAGPSAKSG